MKNALLFCFLGHWLFPFFLHAQQLQLTLRDAADSTTVIGAVATCGKQSAASDVNGVVTLRNLVFPASVQISAPGFLSQKIDCTSAENNLTIFLQSSPRQLDEVVISSSRYEQNVSRVPVSIQLIKPALIENKNTVNLETIIDQVPGVTVTDGQVSMRGQSGFSYGAGSRVMLLVDDMPLLAGDASDIKFNFLPVENIEQVEVMKGAGSALYGSSALNGVINVRTGYAKEKPETRMTYYTGVYDNPMRKTIRWWKNSNPTYSGINLMHSRKVGRFEFVLGSNFFNDEGYRQGEREQRGRINLNTRYNFARVKGLSAGINGNAQATKGALFILWANKDSGALKPLPGTMSNYTTYRAHVDPWITWFAGPETRHTLRARYFVTNNLNDTKQDSRAEVLYSEYLLRKKLFRHWMLNTGMVFIGNRVRSDSLYGNHAGKNAALYVQLNRDAGRWSLSLGARAEYFELNGKSNTNNLELLSYGKQTLRVKSPLMPVARLGITYQLMEFTFLRGSIGQGYRYPSVAEKFVTTSVGSLTVFSNPDLQPEYGYNTELGIKQGFRIGKVYGFADAAFFYNENNNTIEYLFNYYVPDSIKKPSILDKLNYAGFKSRNVGKTLVKGVDLSLNAAGKLRKMGITAMLGYTYTEGVSLNRDSSYILTGSDSSQVLKYRNRHTFKGDVQLDYGKFSVGGSVRYMSFMRNIDVAFQQDLIGVLIPGYNSGQYIVPGLAEYRSIHNTGKTICDLRLGYEVKPGAKISLVVNNVFNIEMMGRPADIQPMRTFALQYLVRF